MKRAWFWSADEYGCGWYRTLEPARGLRSLGWDAQSGTISTMESLGDVDVLIGQRISKEAPTAAWHDLIGITPLVFEADDDLWNIPAKHPGRYYYGDQAVRRRITSNVAVADLVTVSTQGLADSIGRFTTAPIEILPNTLPAETFDLPTITPREDGVVRIGYTSSATHDQDAAPLRSVAQRLSRRYPDRLQWLFYGHDHSDSLGVEGVYVPWQGDIPSYHASLDFDIGIAPLHANEFNLGKSPIKAQEYGARGIPVVASDFGPYREYVTDGSDGFLARRPADFENHLIDLIEDTDLRLAMGVNAREKSATLTTEIMARRWDEALRSVL